MLVIFINTLSKLRHAQDFTVSLPRSERSVVHRASVLFPDQKGNRADRSTRQESLCANESSKAEPWLPIRII